MAASTYTDADRIRVNTELTVHNGNVHAVSRITGIPRQTVTDWKKKWERQGVPDVVDRGTSAAMEKFVEDASRVRDLALAGLEQAIPAAAQAGKAKDLAIIVGVLDDKLTRAQGKPTSITQNDSTVPSAREIQAAMGGFIAGMRDAQRQRELEIIESNTITVQATPADA